VRDTLLRLHNREWSITSYPVSAPGVTCSVVAAERWRVGCRRPASGHYWVLDGYYSVQVLLWPWSEDVYRPTIIGRAGSWDEALYMAELAAVTAAELAGHRTGRLTLPSMVRA